MNVWKQLIRQPVRIIAVMLLLAFTSSFLCLSFGQFRSANVTADAINSSFITIALPTSKTQEVEVPIEGLEGVTVTVEQSVITAEMWEYLHSLPEISQQVKGIYRQNFISGYSSVIQTQTTAAISSKYSGAGNTPYNDAIFAITIEELCDPIQDDFQETYTIEVKATVDQVISLHPDYVPPERVQLTCVFYSQEDVSQADLKVGGQYIVYSDHYVDSDLVLRTRLAELLKCEVEQIDWKNIQYTGTSAVYEMDGHSISMSAMDLQQIGCASMVVQDLSASISEDFHATQIDGSRSDIPLKTLIANPTIAPLTGTVEDFLVQERQWADFAEQAAIRYGCVPILGTDGLESMYQFVSRQAVIVEGRPFSAEDYALGNRVCVLSETVAMASNLTVGDTIDFSYYWGADPYAELINTSSVPAQSYYTQVGFTGGDSYEIIGIYRQSDLWSDTTYSFTPNTVFVPNNALLEQTYTADTGIYYTIVLENGGIGAVQELLTQQGYPEDTLLYFDLGYSELASTIEDFRANAKMQFIVSCVTWLAAIAVFLVLFTWKERRTAGLMLSLGAGKGATAQYLWTISMIPGCLAILVGTGVSAFLLEDSLNKSYSGVQDLLGQDFSTGIQTSAELGELIVSWDAIFIAAASQLVLLCILTIVCATIISAKKPLKLMQKS